MDKSQTERIVEYIRTTTTFETFWINDEGKERKITHYITKESREAIIKGIVALEGGQS